MTSDTDAGKQKYCCEWCLKDFYETFKSQKSRRRGVIANHRDICRHCISDENTKRIAELGAKILKNIDGEEKREYCRKAGKAGKYSANSGRFTTEKWNQKTPLQQKEIVTRASAALHEKLKDAEYSEIHYEKILKGRIGFVSKGQLELFEVLREYGFVLEFRVGSVVIDLCHEELKIAIEYNGDAYHCNPKKYEPDFYSNLIRMTASEKWKKDRNRKFYLRSKGYRVYVIWESDWKTDPKNCLLKINEIIEYETNKKRSST